MRRSSNVYRTPLLCSYTRHCILDALAELRLSYLLSLRDSKTETLVLSRIVNEVFFALMNTYLQITYNIGHFRTVKQPYMQLPHCTAVGGANTAFVTYELVQVEAT